MLQQIGNLINQRNISKIPKHRFNACDDFLDIVMTGHILSAALKAFGMERLKYLPSKNIIASPKIVHSQPNHEWKALLECLRNLSTLHLILMW